MHTLAVRNKVDVTHQMAKNLRSQAVNAPSSPRSLGTSHQEGSRTMCNSGWLL